jgi:hypothetical protein
MAMTEPAGKFIGWSRRVTGVRPLWRAVVTGPTPAIAEDRLIDYAAGEGADADLSVTKLRSVDGPPPGPAAEIREWRGGRIVHQRRGPIVGGAK